MAGDLNCTRKALKEEMGVMYFDDIEEDREMSAVQQGNMFAIADCEVELYEGLPSITGADNRHEVACYDISVARQPVFPTQPCVEPVLPPANSMPVRSHFGSSIWLKPFFDAPRVPSCALAATSAR